MIHEKLQKVFGYAITYARANKHEYITVDHVFIYLLEDPVVIEIFENLQIDVVELQLKLKEYLFDNIPVYN